MDSVIADLANLAGVKPYTVILILVILSKVANVGARKIPEDATGWLAVFRKACAIVGAYVPNQITSTYSASDAAKVALALPEKIEEVKATAAVAANTASTLESRVTSVAQAIEGSQK